jgi:hypothetical protein
LKRAIRRHRKHYVAEREDLTVAEASGGRIEAET